MNYGKLRPLTAWHALKILLDNPEDTAQVFVIVHALSGKSLIRRYNQFAATPNGRRIIAQRRNIRDRLSNRAALAQLPAGSLGRAYLEFVEAEELTADGLVDASVGDHWTDALPASEGLKLYAERMRDSHDLWHVLTRYGRDEIGEICLLGFTFAQTFNPGLAFIAGAGATKVARQNDGRVFRALLAGYNAGRRARWLPSANWEALLVEPLDDVRRQLNIGDPAVYPEIIADAA